MTHRSTGYRRIAQVFRLFFLLTAPAAQLLQAQPAPLPPPFPSAAPATPAALRAALLYGRAEGTTFPAYHLPPAPTETVRADSLSQPPPSDPWFAYDKVQHATVSFFWTLGSQYALVNKASWSEGRALPLSIGISASAGLAKELYDWRARPQRFFSYRDLVADAFGIALAAGFILL